MIFATNFARNYEIVICTYLEHQTLGQGVICPREPVNPRSLIEYSALSSLLRGVSSSKYVSVDSLSEPACYIVDCRI